jgi:hypothetical protein
LFVAYSSVLISASSLSAERGLLAAKAMGADEKRRVTSAVRGSRGHIIGDIRAAALVSSERDGVGAREAWRMLKTKYLLFTLAASVILQFENTAIRP